MRFLAVNRVNRSLLHDDKSSVTITGRVAHIKSADAALSPGVLGQIL